MHGRILRRRARGALAMAVAATLSATAAAATPLTYQLVGIGFLPMDKVPPDPNASYAHDVNDAGVVVGQSTTSIGAVPELATSDFHAVRFTVSGGLEDLGDLDFGGDTSVAMGVNNAGIIVGRGDTLRDPTGLPPDLSDATHAARWPVPTMIEDIGPGTEFSATTAVNDLGNAAGNVGPIASQQGFFWTPSGGMSILSDPVGGSGVFIEDLNDANAIVGFATVSGVERAFLWNAISTPLDLGDLDGDAGASAALGINDAGWIVGSSDDGGAQRAFRRDPGTGVLEGLPHLPGGDFSRARDINASGVAVGSAWDPAALAFHAVLWDSDGTVYDLHDLLTNGAGWVLEEALAISDTGYIVGTARNAAGESEGFLLLPIPEPGAGLLLACGLVLLGWRSEWRR